MRKSSFIALALLVAAASSAIARSAYDSDETITERLNRSGNVTVVHSPLLEKRLVPRSVAEEAQADTVSDGPTSAMRKVAGYRVQIFSDNNARTAKNEAESKARLVAEKFPRYSTYVVYSSPYWRLKLGDFRTRDEAEVAANEIKRKFPEFAREIRVVRDRINIR